MGGCFPGVGFDAGFLFSLLSIYFFCFLFFHSRKEWKVTTRYLELSHIYWVPQQKRPPLDSSSWVPLSSFLFHSSSNSFFSSTQLTAEKREKETTWSSSVICGHCFPPEAPLIRPISSFLPLPLVLSFSFNLTDTQCSLVSLSMCTYTGLSVYTHSLIMGQDSTHTHTYNIQWCCCCCFCFDWPACCWLVVRVRASAAHETQRLSCGFHMQHKKKRKQDAQIIIMIIIIIIIIREREGLWSTFSLFFFFILGPFGLVSFFDDQIQWLQGNRRENCYHQVTR